MALGTCSLCKQDQAKYKCPKCSVEYCSLKCFKSPEHQHTEQQEQPKKPEQPVQSLKPPAEDGKYTTVFQDKQIQYLLSFPALRIHLHSIYEIMTNMTMTVDKRMEMADDKLNSLRIAGVEGNELVEEFCERVGELLKT